MKDLYKKTGIFLFSFALIALSVIPVLTYGQEAVALDPNTDTNVVARGAEAVAGAAIKGLFDLQGEFLKIPLFVAMKILAGILGIVGLILDQVMIRTVVNFSDAIKSITAINSVWATIRDLGNMAFIFILLYHGIRMVLGLSSTSVKKVITGIITAAILVNFSLFFTKALLDASNIITLGFYNSIAAAGGGTPTSGSATGQQQVQQIGSFGFSGAFMKPLGLTGMFDTSGFSSLGASFSDSGKLSVVYIGSIIFLLITILAFLAVSVLFIIRFVAFVILLIMSPLAFLSFAIPGLEGMKTKYWGTLSSQGLFGPLYMFYSWILLRLMGPGGITGSSNASLAEALANPNLDTVSVIINFAILITLLLMSIIEAKKQATKGGFITNNMINKGQAYMGAAVFGSAAWAGRATLGRYATKVAENADLQAKAASGDTVARLQLLTANKLAGSSFDARNTKTMKTATGDVFGLGKIGDFGAGGGAKGYKGYVEEKLKKQTAADKARAEQFKLSGSEEARNKELLEEYEKEIKADPTIEEVKKETRKAVLDKLIADEKQKVSKDVARLEAELTSLTAERTSSENEKRALDKKLQELREKIRLNSLAGISTVSEEALLRTEEARLPAVLNTFQNAARKVREKNAELTEVNKNVVKLESEVKDMVDNIWISPEYEKLIADAGGRAGKKNKQGVQTEKAVSSTSNTNISSYAKRVEGKTGFWSAYPNILIDSEYSKRRARAVKKLAKPEKTAAQLIAEAAKLQKKEDEKKGIKDEDDEDDGKPAPAQAPAANPPTTP